MFNKNTYMIPQGSAPSTSVLDLSGNEILLHHHNMFSGHYLAANAPPVEAAAALFNQDIGETSGTLNTCPRTPKRDRHSKIDTAQGPRDRRVRLSIGVARKFFDLQEMLGFDKPSKTLDWLLTKSKTAIKDLVNTTKQSSSGAVVSSPTPSDECEVENDDYALEKGPFFGADSKGKSVMTSGNSKLQYKGGAKDLIAKESRVKARARARERTREKMCIKQLSETRNTTTGYYDLINPSNNNIPIQYMNNQLEYCRISGSSGKLSGIDYAMNYQECGGGDLINQEPVVIKRKVKHHPSPILGFQPNLILSRDLGSNYGYSNATDDQNWDHISSFNSSQSNISAILDQHKFNNR